VASESYGIVDHTYPAFGGSADGMICALRWLALKRQSGQSACVAVVDVLRSVLRAAEPAEALATLGFTISGAAPNLRIDYPAGVGEVHQFPLADLASGFVRASTWEAGFDRWASVVVMTDWIEVEDLETRDGEILWEAVWSVAGGEDASEAALALAHDISSA
jgi:hypothetical protein